MATRFIHVLLSMDNLIENKIDEKSKAFFFLGSIYPDLIFDKRKSHFEKNSLLYSHYNLTQINKMITAANKKADRLFYLGWKYHIVIDQLWQDYLIKKQFFKVFWWHICFHKRIKDMYYNELSYYDTFIRDKLDKNKLATIKNYMVKYLEFKNNVPVTKNYVFDSFIGDFQNDLDKKISEPKIHMIDEKLFNSFYDLAVKKIHEAIVLYS